MKKRIVCILAIAVIASFSACSVSQSKETTTAALKTTVDDLGKSISYALTEEDAKNVAYDALKEKYSYTSYEIYGCDYTAFEFSDISLMEKDEGCIAFNQGYGNTGETENFSGHAYYCVTYENTTQLCDVAYICIDAVNGDLLYSGYMGD